jgi:uroporphyrinogen-III synthase
MAPARRRVLLTRSEEDNAEWAERLAATGAVPVELPCIHCETLDTPAVHAHLQSALASTDWVVFTSRRGVAAFARLTARGGAPWRVAVVGAATAAAARDELGRVDVVGRGGTAAALADTLAADGDLAQYPRVVLALAENAGDTLERKLAAAGARCTRCNVYRTVPAPPAASKRSLAALHVDNVVLASPSAVTGFVNQVAVDSHADVYTIGPSTTAAAENAGLIVTAEAREPSFEGLLEAMQWRS